VPVSCDCGTENSIIIVSLIQAIASTPLAAAACEAGWQHRAANLITIIVLPARQLAACAAHTSPMANQPCLHEQPCMRAQPCVSEQPCMQGATACLAAWVLIFLMHYGPAKQHHHGAPTHQVLLHRISQTEVPLNATSQPATTACHVARCCCSTQTLVSEQFPRAYCA
jgi:hypothetical protein